MGVRSTDGNSLFFATGFDNEGLSYGINEAEGLIENFASTVSRINPFAALAVAAISAFAIISKEAYKMVSDFENAMAEVKTIANIPEKEFKELEQNVYGIYKRLGTEPPDKLANGLYEIIGAGFEASEALEILEISSMSATAGITTTAVASDGLTTILNAFRLEASDAQEVADIMFATVDRGKISFEELSSQIATVAPLAASSGISFREIGAAISTLTKQGVPAGVAMTQIRSAIISTNEVLGDGWSKTMSLQEAFQVMYDKAEGGQTKLKDLAGRIEAVNAIIGIAGPNFQGANEDLEAMANSAGSVSRSFNIVTSTASRQWEIFGNKIKATTKNIGDAFLEMSSGIVKALNGIQSVNSLKDQRDQLNKLVLQLKLNIDNQKEFSNIISEINSKYPNFLKNLSDEEIKRGAINDLLIMANEQYIKQIAIKEKEDELKEVIDDQAKAYKGLFEIVDQNSEVLNTFNVEQTKVLNNFIKGNSTYDETIKELEKLGDVTGEQRVILSTMAPIVDKNSGSLNGYKDNAEALAIEIKKLEEFLKKFANTQGDLTSKTDQQAIAYKNLIEQLEKFQHLVFGLSQGVDATNDVDNRSKVKARIDGLREELETVEFNSKREKEILKEISELENRLNPKKSTRTGGARQKSDADRYKEELDKKAKQYQSYEAFITQIGKEEADKRFKELLKEGDNYTEYLQNKYNQAKSYSQQIAVVESAESNNVRLKRFEQELPDKSLTPAGLDLDFKITPTIDMTKYEGEWKRSVEEIQNDINWLEGRYNKSHDDNERERLATVIDSRKKELEEVQKYLNKEKKAYEYLNIDISKLNNKALREYIAHWEKKIKEAEAGSDEIKEAEGKIEVAKQEIKDNTTDAINNIANGLSEIGSLFQKFGDDDMAELLGQLAGVAEGIGQITSGDYVGGALQIVSSALTVEIDSETPKFEEAIKELEKAIDKLDYSISKSVGTDRIDNRLSMISDLQELEEQAQLAQQAELEARKEVKVLGLSIGKKGKGSGTDQAKLEELEQKAEDARRKAEELREQLDELYTGTTEKTIVDSIISGLKEGKKSAKDFADDFKGYMQDAMLQAFQTKYLEKEVEQFYTMFAQAGSDSNYTADEIKELQNFYNTLITGAQSDLDAINQILEETGIGALGSGENGNSNKNSLAGAISTITEDTANIVAGIMNSQLVELMEITNIAKINSDYLNKIADNTSYLPSMDNRLKNIEDSLS